MTYYIIHTDGGARGNPGPAAIGVVIEQETAQGLKKVATLSKRIGEATNNQAEYRAVIFALEKVHSLSQNQPVVVSLYLDSELIAEQLAGNYRVRNVALQPLYRQVQSLITKLGGNVSFCHLLREANREADRLVNLALDSR